MSRSALAGFGVFYHSRQRDGRVVLLLTPLRYFFNFVRHATIQLSVVWGTYITVKKTTHNVYSSENEMSCFVSRVEIHKLLKSGPEHFSAFVNIYCIIKWKVYLSDRVTSQVLFIILTLHTCIYHHPWRCATTLAKLQIKSSVFKTEALICSLAWLVVAHLQGWW